jgi:hypothetical protein
MNAAAWGALSAGQPPRRFVQRVLPWLLAVGLHAALLAPWSGPQLLPARPDATPAPFVMQLELLPAPPAATPRPVPTNGATGAAAAPGRPAQPVQAVRRPASTLATMPPAVPPADRATGRVDAAAAPGTEALPGEPATAAVKDGTSAPLLLDTPAIRQALRAVARGPSLRALGDAAVGAARPLSPEERLGQDVARAARGDCLKSEFFGGGAGLLSLPFWLAAEAGGKCRR